MKVLQLCNKPPFPPTDGGMLAMNSVTQGLLEAGCSVRVLSMESDKHPVCHESLSEGYKEHTHFESVKVDLGVKALPALMALLCGESYNVKRYENGDFAKAIEKVLNEEKFDVIHVESIFLTPYVEQIRKMSDAAVVLRAHNVEHKIWRQMSRVERNLFKKWYYKQLSLTLAAYEREHLNDYDGVVSITDRDGAELKAMGCRVPMTDIPFGIERKSTPCVNVEPNSLFHLGSMDWLPNLEGVNWFLKEVWPEVHRRVPEATLYLAGKRMPQKLLAKQMEGVKVIGEVEDANGFIESKTVNIVPLLSGSGIRVKIIEAMAMGKVVVSTTVGAQGIHYKDGANLLIADSAQDFARQIERCVRDRNLARQIGENAARLVEEEYMESKLAQRLMRFYEDLLSKKQ